MLATLGRVWVSVGEKEAAEKVGSDEVCETGAELGSWWGAGAIPSISPTSSGATIEPSSARSPALGAVDWPDCLRIALVGVAGWP
jgi:hypothetical protein